LLLVNAAEDERRTNEVAEEAEEATEAAATITTATKTKLHCSSGRQDRKGPQLHFCLHLFLLRLLNLILKLAGS
jgi:hypothetical protein